jgi:hypothetical protein
MEALELTLRLPEQLYQRLAQTARLAQCDMRELLTFPFFIRTGYPCG